MAKDRGKTIVGLGIVGLIGAILLTRKAKAISPENILLSNLITEPAEVYVGEPISISVTATNTGETTGSYQVTCEVI